MGIITAVVLLSVLGFAGRTVARRVGLPAISGYLLAGMILGHSVSGALSDETITDLSDYVTPLSLGFIAYLIGGRLKLSSLNSYRRQIAVITMAEALVSWLLTILAIVFIGPLVLPESSFDFNTFLAMGFLAGAISLATAPAATLAIVEESHANGPVTVTLLAVVAIDDALAALAYSISIVIGTGLLGGDNGGASAEQIFIELAHIGISVGIGMAGAWLLLRVASVESGKRTRQALVIASLLMVTGVIEHYGLSVVLACMTAGFIVANQERMSSDLVSPMRVFEGAVFALFFTLAGAHLDIGVLREAGPLALLIILGRSAGKVSGVSAGANFADAPEAVRRYLPLLLLPQAGITLGLALHLLEEPALAAVSSTLVPAILASTLINEMVAPPISRWALSAAGEANQDSS